ncbi:MAG: hypothetical protein ACREAC_19590, partial [Blastocatellia bacterium]
LGKRKLGVDFPSRTEGGLSRLQTGVRSHGGRYLLILARGRLGVALGIPESPSSPDSEPMLYVGEDF